VIHTAHFINSIDWLSPWLAPWQDIGQRAAQLIAQGQCVHQALNALANAACPVEFAPQEAMPEGAAYEQFIFEQRRVPTRENLHDFFNGLVWLQFPHTKSRLNALQHGEIRAHGIQATRGPLRDALTLFDENAAFVCLPDPVLTALRERDWHTALVTHRQVWIDSPPLLFGHALLEKLVSPYKSITAHVFTAQSAINPVAKRDELDALIAAQLLPERLVPKPFLPLPVLGVPLWSVANSDPAFYRDASVFRTPRPALAATD
jgi:hypothetical protein